MNESSEIGADTQDAQVIANGDNSSHADSELSEEEQQHDDNDNALSLEQQSPPLPPVNPDFDVKVHDDIEQQKSNDDEEEKVNKINRRKKSSSSSRDKTNKEKGRQAEASSDNEPRRKVGRRHRKGRLVMRQASVDEPKENATNLPREIYETVLVRRAIRKMPTTTPSDQNQQHNDEPKYDPDDGEIYGDTSLGMKLNVMGGKVIVQSLNPLADGRASPAQLSGMIQRGDVLLQINDVSLVNLPLDQLMKGLGPLSTADERTGAYQRSLKLRLASGRGLELLRQAKGNRMDQSTAVVGATVPIVPMDPAADMFSLFPMVDQMGGIPIRGNMPLTPPPAEESTKKKQVIEVDEKKVIEVLPSPVALPKASNSLSAIIGERLAEERYAERKKVVSEFFSRADGISLTLQYLESGEEKQAAQTLDDDSFAGLSPAEMIDIGAKALKGAKALSAIMERVDKGSDRRSFQSLSATLSLYSRASTRRRYVLDGRAMPVNFDKVREAAFTEEEEDEEEDGESDSEANSDEGDQLDGDELLLQLAATDEIWKKQVTDFLEQVIEQGLEETSEDSTHFDANAELSNELGSFLFGTNMTEVLKRRKKSHALPPPEITSLLFDLTTKISSTVPDRIKAEGASITVRSSLVPFIGIKRPAANSNIMLANHFLLNQVLPLWLKSFRPLPLDQRRILWPSERAQNLESTAGSTLSGDDLTVDSMATKNTGTGSRARKNLREQIEDSELDPESRAETCFLTTYYFAQHLLPRLLPVGGTSQHANGEVFAELTDFVSQFGSYLRLHTCLAYAAVLKSPKLIDSLLEVAKYDPRHREVMKQTSRPSALVIYDSTMLSAVVQRLKDIRVAKSPERRVATIDWCSKAYPDLRPWQVKKECDGSSGLGESSEKASAHSDLYYTYLSQILHPIEGHDEARHDTELVKEYCILSVKGKNEKRRSNFLQVASKTSSDHMAFSRDLPFLLKLSMDAQEFDLALDLAAEILDTNTDLNSEASLRVLISYVTSIGRRSVDGFLEDKDSGTRGLKRVLRLYCRISTLGTDAAKSIVDIPLELIMLLEHTEVSPSGSRDGVIDLIQFFANEARPEDVMEALIRWCTPSNINDDLYPVFQTILKQGARHSVSNETSGSLHRVLLAHSRFEETVVSLRANGTTIIEVESAKKSAGSLWTQLSHGTLALDK